MTLLDRPARAGLSRTAAGLSVPTALERLRLRTSRLNDRWWGWLGPIAVTVMTFLLQVWHLGTPRQFSFDETYYAKDAWSMLNNGYDRNYITPPNGESIDTYILAGHTHGIWTSGPSIIVHPEVGKWMIALGEATFGMNPFGWRISACVVGALMVLVMCRLARRLTGSTMLGCVAGLLMCFDGMHYVLSRLALLDIFMAFWLLCGVACIINDRDWMRARMARRLAEQDDETEDVVVRGPYASAGLGGWGPVRGLIFRPWLLAGGVTFGLACGTKWDAVYPLMVFGLMSWLWSAGARRSAGVRLSLLRSALVDGVPAFVQLVMVAVIVYVASWTGWLIHANQYEQYTSATQYTQFVSEGPCVGSDPNNLTPDNKEDPNKHWPTSKDEDAHGFARIVDSLASLAYYHHDVYVFHTHFLNCATHPYGSKPSGWLLLNRPVGVATDLKVQPGTQSCPSSASQPCYREVLLLGTPLLWWGGCAALILAGILWVAARDWRYGVAIIGTLSTWLPWLQYDDRPIFSYYAIATLPFLILAIVLAMGKMLGPSTAPSTRRTIGVVVSGSFFVLVVLNFAYFYPIYSFGVLTQPHWHDRIWFARWV